MVTACLGFGSLRSQPTILPSFATVTLKVLDADWRRVTTEAVELRYGETVGLASPLK
jgi:hypothetical protein